jgi:hypothetical protein
MALKSSKLATLPFFTLLTTPILGATSATLNLSQKVLGTMSAEDSV